MGLNCLCIVCVYTKFVISPSLASSLTSSEVLVFVFSDHKPLVKLHTNSMQNTHNLTSKWAMPTDVQCMNACFVVHYVSYCPFLVKASQIAKHFAKDLLAEKQ